MYHAEGVGLAAPQIGILKRVIVVDVGDEHGLIEMINPVILKAEGEQLGPEGASAFRAERRCAPSPAYYGAGA